MKKNIFFSILILTTIFTSCHKNAQRYQLKNTGDEKKVEVKIHRFDTELINLDTTKALESTKELYQKYPRFMPLYVYNILQAEPADTAQVAQFFTRFVSDTAFQKINKKEQEIFSNVSDIEKELSDAFTNVHAYFPQIIIPQVYFFVSGFNRAVLMTDSILGVGTDFYLGADYAPYQEFTYDYLLYNMRRDMVPIDVVSATLFINFPFDGKQNRLIDNMLYRGKLVYIISSFMPERKIEDIIGYSPEQMKWAEKYEPEVWKSIVGQSHLFSTNVELIGKYVNDAPFTAPITQDSPGRLGIYIGWKVAESYMNKNKNVTLQELVKMNDYQKMQEQSGYKP